MRTAAVALLLTGIPCFSKINAGAASPESPTHAATPTRARTTSVLSRETVLMEATIACGWGEVYSVRRGRYTAPELAALETLLHFRFSGPEVFGISFEERSPSPVSAERMRQLLDDPVFRTRIGPAVLARTRALLDSRARLARAIDSLQQDPDPERFLRHPRVRAYQKEGQRFLSALGTRFEFTVRDNGVDCD